MALRVARVPRAKVLIALDRIVPVTHDERRMRPEHAWDWRRMLAVASGQVARHTGAVGGPRAANRMGKAVAPGTVVPPMCQTMAFLSQGCAIPVQPGSIWPFSQGGLTPREQRPPRGGGSTRGSR